jgi:hypothetical protein
MRKTRPPKNWSNSTSLKPGRQTAPARKGQFIANRVLSQFWLTSAGASGALARPARLSPVAPKDETDVSAPFNLALHGLVSFFFVPFSATISNLSISAAASSDAFFFGPVFLSQRTTLKGWPFSQRIRRRRFQVERRGMTTNEQIKKWGMEKSVGRREKELGLMERKAKGERPGKRGFDNKLEKRGKRNDGAKNRLH